MVPTSTFAKYTRLVSKLLGIFFLILTFIFCLQIIQGVPDIFTQQFSVQSLIIGIAVFLSLLYIQSITAYGLLTYKDWVRYILFIHSGTVILTVLFILPILELKHLIAPTIKSAIPYILITCMSLLAVKLNKTRVLYKLLIIFGYLVSLGIVLYFGIHTK